MVAGGLGLRSGVPVPVDTLPALLLVAQLGRAGLTLAEPENTMMIHLKGTVHLYIYLYLYLVDTL